MTTIGKGDLQSLEEIYCTLPETMCAGCGHCCTLFAGMRYVEFLAVRAHIELHWRPEKNERLRERVRLHHRFRSIYIDAPPELPFLIPNVHCLFYDDSSQRCTIYPVRPLDCRLFGLRGECDRVMMQNNPTVHVSTQVSLATLAEARGALARLNSSFTDTATGRTIDAAASKPIEFWFALFEVAWDPTLDQDDERYLQNLIRIRESRRLPRD